MKNKGHTIHDDGEYHFVDPCATKKTLRPRLTGPVYVGLDGFEFYELNNNESMILKPNGEIILDYGNNYGKEEWRHVRRRQVISEAVEK